MSRLWRDPILLLTLAGLLLAAIVYPALHGIYRPDNGDDAWSLSFLYNYRHHGIEHDATFGVPPDAGGQNGVQFFGKLQAALYGAVLDRAGWTRGHAHALSTALLALAALAWGLVARRLTGSAPLGAAAGMLVLVLEPFFGAANGARPEAMILLLAALALAAFLARWPLAAGLLAACAFEVHPMGLMAAVYIGGVWLADLAAPGRNVRRSLAGLLPLALGFALGLGAYALLHAQHLARLPSALLGGNPDDQGGYLAAYFFHTKYLRHLPELVLLAAAAVVFAVRRADRAYPRVAGLVAAALVSLLLFRRANFQYAVYPYLAFVLLLLCAAQSIRKVPALLAALLLLLAPQYGFVYAKNHAFDFQARTAAVRAAVPADGQPVVGDPSSWFAFQDRPFYATDFAERPFLALGLPRFYLVENEAFRGDERYRRLRELIARRYEARPVAELTLFGEPFAVKDCARREEP